MRVPSTDIYRIVDGRIVEQWTVLDYTGLMHQLGLLPAQGHGAPASTEANRTLTRRFVEEVLTGQRLDRADELVAPGYVDHGVVPGQAPGLAGAKRKWAMVFAALPDLRVPIEDLVAEGDRVAVRWTAEGTHRGELLGVPPTGKRLRFTGMSLCRFEDGRLVEQWEQADRLRLAQQLGAVPASPPAARPVAPPARDPAA